MVYLRAVTTLALDRERYVGCGPCREVCPHEVLGWRQGKA